MALAMKRPCTVEEILEVALKRSRLDPQLEHESAARPQEAQQVASEVLAAYEAASASKRQLAEVSEAEDPLPAPAEKRSKHIATDDEPGTPQADRDTAVRHATEAIVRSLQNCPSLSEAVTRVAKHLGELHDGPVLQRVGKEASPSTEDQAQHEAQQRTNQLLMRAVKKLAERCRRLEAPAGEADALRHELCQIQEQLNRVNMSNEVLNSHLSVHFDNLPM